MKVYQIIINRSAIKKLQKIQDPYYSKIKESIYKLAIEPRPAGNKKLKGREAYRIRVADYRIIYTINDRVLIVEVLDLGHRRNIY